MANALYSKGKNAFLSSALQWSSTCSFGLVLVASTYSVNLVTHDNLDDITTAQRVASVALAGLSASDGAADASNACLSAVSGSKSNYIVLFRSIPGDDASSSLIAYIDTATGLPLTPSGGDVLVQFASASPFIFSIGN